MTTLYNCKSEIDVEGIKRYRITKFDDSMNVQGSYLCTATTCSCPAMGRPSCRHRDMLPKFIARGAVNTHWFLDFDRDSWVSTLWEGEPAASAGATVIDEDEVEIIEPMSAMGDGTPHLGGVNAKDITPEVRRASSPSPSPTPIFRRF